MATKSGIDITHFEAGINTFARFPYHPDLDTLDADVAVFGMPYESTFGFPGTRSGPRGIREASAVLAYEWRQGYEQLDDGEVYFENGIDAVDCGDSPVLGNAEEPSFSDLRQRVEKIAASRAFPIFLGGDHAVTTGFLEGLASRGPFGLIHIDAHLDWHSGSSRHYDQGSPIRRASEMNHVTRIAQFGIRHFPGASMDDLAEARAYGSIIQSVQQVRTVGVAEAVARVPRCDRYYLTIDIDGMDPSIAPGTGINAFGGFLYEEVRELLKAIAKLGDFVGMDMVEVSPPLDSGRVTTSLAVRLISDFVGFVFKEREKRVA
jgi:agmatinase